jgi:hypothetical protein
MGNQRESDNDYAKQQAKWLPFMREGENQIFCGLVSKRVVSYVFPMIE